MISISGPRFNKKYLRHTKNNAEMDHRISTGWHHVRAAPCVCVMAHLLNFGKNVLGDPPPVVDPCRPPCQVHMYLVLTLPRCSLGFSWVFLGISFGVP